MNVAQTSEPDLDRALSSRLAILLRLSFTSSIMFKLCKQALRVPVSTGGSVSALLRSRFAAIDILHQVRHVPKFGLNSGGHCVRRWGHRRATLSAGDTRIALVLARCRRIRRGSYLGTP